MEKGCVKSRVFLLRRRTCFPSPIGAARLTDFLIHKYLHLTLVLSVLIIVRIHSSAKGWALGCVNSPPLAAAGGGLGVWLRNLGPVVLQSSVLSNCSYQLSVYLLLSSPLSLIIFWLLRLAFTQFLESSVKGWKEGKSGVRGQSVITCRMIRPKGLSPLDKPGVTPFEWPHFNQGLYQLLALSGILVKY